MKPRKAILILLFFVILMLPVSGVQKIRVAVAPVQSVDLKSQERTTLTDLIQSELVKTGYYDVIESQRMDEVLKAQKNMLKDLYTNESAAKLGSLLSADKIILGRIGTLGTSVIVLTLKVVDVRTGKVDQSESERMRRRDDMVDAVKRVTKKLVDGFPKIGKIIRKREKYYYTDLGKRSGIVNGDHIAVERLEEVLKDDKGREFFRKTKRIALLKVIEVQPLGSAAVILKEYTSTDIIQKNDMAIFLPRGKIQATTALVKFDTATPLIEVAFVLDTTGSMSRLINGAKKKIWIVANDILKGDPQPNLRVAVIGYRDIGDTYVTREFPFRENIDEVQDDLRQLNAGGGGDFPEHVLKGLYQAIHHLQWSKNDSLKIIFLVGDAPPHFDYQDGYTYDDIVKSALKKGIIINTIRCGNRQDTQTAFMKFSNATNGECITLAQSGGMVHYTTPYDVELSRLNDELGQTFISYGRDSVRSRSARRVMKQKKLSVADKAGAAVYNYRRSKLDDSDLLEKLEKETVKAEELKKNHLPAKLQRMSLAERKTYIDSQIKKRKKIRKRIKELSKLREKNIARQRSTGRSSFDAETYKTIQKQAKKINVKY